MRPGAAPGSRPRRPPDGRRARRAGSSARGGRANRARWWRRSSLLLQQPPDAHHRDRDPIGPVVELVLELVDRLLELEQRQQAPDLGLAGRQQRRVDPLEVALEESLAGAWLEVLGRALAAQDLDRGRCVGERPEHARHVAQRRALLPALVQGPRGLALEVDDHPGTAAREGLAEVVVAVGPDHAPADADLRPRGELLAHVLRATGDVLDALIVG